MKGYLYYAGIVAVSTILQTIQLKAIIKRDSIGKIIGLALTISLITIMSYEAHDRQTKIWYWITCVNVLIAILWISQLVLNLGPMKDTVAKHINSWKFSSSK
jgi:uncharacterized membrane protein YhaH (DUF805 family)